MTRELASVLGNQTPLRKFKGLGAFHVESSDLVASKLKPKHFVSRIKIQVVLLRVLREQFRLGHQVRLTIYELPSWLQRNLRAFWAQVRAGCYLRPHAGRGENICLCLIRVLSIFASQIFDAVGFVDSWLLAFQLADGISDRLLFFVSGFGALNRILSASEH